MLDVSGGALVVGSGAITGGAAGSLTLSAGSPVLTTQAPGELRLGAQLLGYSLTQGGSLNLTATALRLGSSTGTPDAAGTLRLGADFLNRGGFQSFGIRPK